MFNNILKAFKEENGYTPEAYDGYYKRQPYWESELSGWLSIKGFPCIMYSERKNYPTLKSMDYDHIGLEMDHAIATLFVITWS
jgi:hypothetical protein